MASKLILYNLANLALGERKLVSLAEQRPSRRRLDTVWEADGVRECLAEGFWNFAMDEQRIEYNTSVTPAFGFAYAFDKPEGWVRTYAVSNDGRFENGSMPYDDKREYILADSPTIYVKFVSGSTDFGGDLSLWPEKFTAFAAHHFAHKVCIAATNSMTAKDDIGKERKRLLLSARSTDAMDENVKFLPAGSWSRARRGGGGRGDGGNTGSLTG